MKKITVLFVLLPLLFLAAGGCSNSKDDVANEVSLSQNSLNASSLDAVYTVVILGGSGAFTAHISNPGIATVNIETQATENLLRIHTKQEGQALITVTDTRNGKKAECALSIEDVQMRYEVTDIVYGIDADYGEVIELDLENNLPYPVGSYFSWKPIIIDSPADGPWSVGTANGLEKWEGSFSSDKIELKDRPSSYGLIDLNLNLNQQILTSVSPLRFFVDLEERTHIYDLILVTGPPTRREMPTLVHCRFYEDLTEYYQTKFPEANVRRVARAYLGEFKKM